METVVMTDSFHKLCLRVLALEEEVERLRQFIGRQQYWAMAYQLDNFSPPAETRPEGKP